MQRWIFLTVGASFVLDAYDLFLVNILMIILSDLYPPTDLELACLAASTLVGATLGQLICGWLSARTGKGAAFVLSMGLIVFSMLGIVASFQNDDLSIYWLLTLWRFVLGFAIGLEYPLSANIIADFTQPGHPRPGRKVVAIFSAQGIGNCVAPLVVLCLLFIEAFSLDIVWRMAFLVALLPTFVLVHLRFKLHAFVTRQEQLRLAQSRDGISAHHHHHYQSDASGTTPEAIVVEEEGGSERAATTEEGVPPTRRRSRQRQSREEMVALVRPSKLRDRLNLLGCSLAWFLFDIAFYGTALFSAVVLKKVFDVDDSHPSRSELRLIALGTALIALIGLPGYWCAVAFVDAVGHRRVQILGFLVMTLLYAAMGFWYDAVAANMWFFVALYGLTFFFSNFGPNATTYLLPTQVFAVEHRTTYHGYAAAAGKAGAIVGSFFFKFLVDAAGVDATLYVCALTSLLGLVATVVFIREPAKEAPDVAKQLAEEETYLVPGPDGISRVSFGSISQLSST